MVDPNFGPTVITIPSLELRDTHPYPTIADAWMGNRLHPQDTDHQYDDPKCSLDVLRRFGNNLPESDCTTSSEYIHSWNNGIGT